MKALPPKWVTLGATLGAVTSALSWFGNFRSYGVRPRIVGISAFPDLLTVLALPALLFVFMRIIARADEGSTRKGIRGAGMKLVAVGATFYAVAHMVLGIVVFSNFFFSRQLVIIAFAMGFVGFALLGWLSVRIVARWVVPSRPEEVAT